MNIAVPEFGGSEVSRALDFLATVPVIEIPEETRDRNRLVGLESHDERARAFNLLR